MHDCEKIKAALNICCADGNTVLEETDVWSKMKLVIYMKKALQDNTKVKIQKKVDGLQWWTTPATTWDAASQGCYCDDCKVALLFPIQQK